jgi:hypothetical protein
LTTHFHPIPFGLAAKRKSEFSMGSSRSISCTVANALFVVYSATITSNRLSISQRYSLLKVKMMPVVVASRITLAVQLGLILRTFFGRTEGLRKL